MCVSKCVDIQKTYIMSFMSYVVGHQQQTAMWVINECISKFNPQHQLVTVAFWRREPRMQGSSGFGNKNNMSFSVRPCSLFIACATLRVLQLEKFLLALCDTLSQTLIFCEACSSHYFKYAKHMEYLTFRFDICL